MKLPQAFFFLFLNYQHLKCNHPNQNFSKVRFIFYLASYYHFPTHFDNLFNLLTIFFWYFVFIASIFFSQLITIVSMILNHLRAQCHSNSFLLSQFFIFNFNLCLFIYLVFYISHLTVNFFPFIWNFKLIYQKYRFISEMENPQIMQFILVPIHLQQCN
jgi:hypothetical protein